MGICDGYQIFETPNKLKDDENAWKVYKTILANCAGRDQGASIQICTMGGYYHFKHYLDLYPNSSYFTIYNLSDPLSPYQIHFESNQFMDKNNQQAL